MEAFSSSLASSVLAAGVLTLAVAVAGDVAFMLSNEIHSSGVEILCV